MQGRNESLPLVINYFRLMQLKKLGFVFEGDKLDTVDAEIYGLISDKMSDLEMKDRKRKR